MRIAISFLGFALLVLGHLCAVEFDEFRIEREENFAFAQVPQIARSGDRVEIAFETQGFCDVSIAVEDESRRILRHVASGVLGENAPPPFAKGTRKQTVVWDGKDDAGKYLDDKDRLSVRVSLGLKPAFEKSLLHSPYKRVSSNLPIFAPSPQGMLVYDGLGVDMIRLYGRDGRYLRTVYPFPADKLDKTEGLHWGTFPQDGKKLPLREGHVQATLLSSGTNAGFDEFGTTRFRNYVLDKVGRGASAVTAAGTRISVVGTALNRLATDGTTGGLPLGGPATCSMQVNKGRNHDGFGGYMPGGEEEPIGPNAAALSPDGKWLYLTDYVWAEYIGSAHFRYPRLQGVARVAYEAEADGKVETFAGKLDRDATGSKPGQFKDPVSVGCDAQGRVYVADRGNDRIQVFAPDGQHLKDLSVKDPSYVCADHRTGAIYALSGDNKSLSLLRFASFEKPRPEASLSVPLPPLQSEYGGTHGYVAAVDPWADPPVLWIAARGGRRDEAVNRDPVLFAEKNGRLVKIFDFAEEAKKELVRLDPPMCSRQRLVANPKTGELWVLEGDGALSKSVLEALVIHPETGKQRIVTLPHDTEDLAFGPDGLAYLRGLKYVTRWEPAEEWREVPWDYGEEADGINHNNETGKKKRANAIAALRVPVRRYNHQGGMWVGPTGNLAVCSFLSGVKQESRKDTVASVEIAQSYEPTLYPGRSPFGVIHIWDRRGKLVHEDAVPGLSFTHGIAVDKDDDLYVMAVGARIYDGKRYWNAGTNTLMKFTPGRARIVCTHKIAPVALGDGKPQRPPDLVAPGGGRLDQAWVEGAEWFYGGVGYHGRHEKAPGYGCECWNSRMALDGYARSFAPEVDHYSVAVLDTAGNVILRVGQYGNADSAGAQSAVPLGGDEVGLFYAPYVATHSDRRLYIADPGNRRIASVKLGYHTDAVVKLADVADAEK